ncbi:hypothetical protein [Microbacterium candidum]|uniref:Uncharacterized protein n=1 Tax=Microbacterium candidum TaxID=3041922 RepID=A0ABT7MXK4_9MICO|nr:hypothetical protein [Microbacterium sp. ASV49]MDL9979156.1 hypothetical protein [Microbacterium sp. ASV49]
MIGGRNGWIAWPAGLLCAGVVAGLAYLAAPAVPSVIAFAGNTLRNALSAPQAGGAPPQKELTDDCRTLYPGILWIELGWNPQVVLAQSTAPPSVSVAAVRDGLKPQVRMTCAWRNSGGGTVTTTLAAVDPTAAAIAQPALAAAGFACTPLGDGIRCTKSAGTTNEDEVVRGGMWLSTTEVEWHPPGYSDQLIARLWPAATP